MLQTPPLQPLSIMRTAVPHSTQAPPYSPTLINLNQKYNMSANSLTEALLLLSGMYISLVQPDPGPVKIALHAVFPKTSGAFLNDITHPFLDVNRRRTYMKYPAILPAFNISSSITRSHYAPKDVLNMLCDSVFPQNTITIFYINNHLSLQEYDRPTVSYLPKVIESLGLPIISYDTQFSPNDRPELSIQLAPTMGQMMDVMFAFLRRFGWSDFSFLCTLSYGCQDEISYIRLKIDEYKRQTKLSVYGVEMYSYQLMSYVNFTSGSNETEVREKLMYELHKDSRINLFHGSGSEVKAIMDMAKQLGLTGKDYVWIFTSASITLAATIVDESYPVGSFVIGFNSSREMMRDVVRDGVNIWMEALNNLALSSDMDSMDFNTGFSCERNREAMAGQAGNDSLRSPLYWKYGETLYRYIRESKLPGGLQFDEYGVLKANRFYILNIQHETNTSTVSDDSSDTRSTGRGGPTNRASVNESPRRPVAQPQPLSSRDSQQSAYSQTNENSESRLPDTRNRDGGSPFSRERDTGSPFSRERDTGSPFSRDRDTGSPFSRNRDGGSPFSRDKVTGSPISRGRDRDSPSHLRASDSFESRHFRTDSSKDANAAREKVPVFSNGSTPDLEHTQLPVMTNDDSSRLPVSTRNDAYGNYNDGYEAGHSGETWSRRSSDMSNQDGIRKRRKDGYHGDRGHHKIFDQGNGNINRERHGNSYNSSETGRLHGRFARNVQRKQVAKKIADWDGHNLMVYDITWPGGTSIPPKGKPEKYMLKVVTWQEDPHVIYREMKPGDKENETICEINSVPCTIYNRNKALRRTNGTRNMCCAGLCIDLLMRLGEKLNFDVQITEVDDGGYGSPLNANLTEWNGMLGMLIKKEADLAIGALSITPERSAAVDFSVPFLQTGITIIVALRHGVISATAFLEPYDYPSWSLILLFSVHATGASIFIFEWLSPYGLDQGKTSYSVHKFSLFRSFWLIWAMLFGASVSTDQPRGMASRFLANIWALFAVVFCASYTANLAAFMITKDTYYDLSGIQDWRLKNPHHVKPPFKFATIANSSIDLNIKKNYKEIYQYMKNEAQTDVKDAIKNLKAGNIQAFIYDSTTLEYEVGKDDGCKLKNVGKRIAETGYGVAFPKRSQWVKDVDRALLQLQENGEIERLKKHWLARACHNKKETGVSSHTLGILNFTSAFVLLGSGIVLGVLILLLEHMYFRFGRKSLKKWDKCGCCSLVSLSMGQSLTFEQSVMEAMDYHKHHRCRDPLCETQLWKVKHDLDIALLKISQLRRQLASSASFEAAMGGGYGASSKCDREVSPNQNGSARRRRQQARDAGPDKMTASANEPLLALEGRSDTDEDNTPVQSPKHSAVPFSNRSSFPAAKNKANGNESSRYSYPDQDHPKGKASEDRPGSRMTTEPRNIKPPETGRHKMAELEFHPPPPSFDEALTRYRTSPTDDMMTPSPSPPQTSSPPPPAAPSPPDRSPQGGISILSDSNASNSSPSSDDKRYEPFILDSPESPSFSSFSETSENRLSCPGTLSKLSDEIPSTAVSQDMDSNFTSSPEMSKSLDEANTFPHVGHAAGPKFSNAQNKHLVSPIDSVRPSALHEDPSDTQQMSQLNTSKEADNDVNTRRIRDNDGNIYVNIDDMTGRETSF